jgi:hypothetical protein
VDLKRPLAAAEVERLQQSRQSEPVVGVEVGDEDLGQLGEPDRLHELALRALAAVEQDPVPPASTSSAGRPRRAVGTEAAVPAKRIERSMAGQCASTPSVGTVGGFARQACVGRMQQA